MTPKPLTIALLLLMILRLFARRIILTLRRKKIITWKMARVKVTIRAAKIILNCLLAPVIILVLLAVSLHAWLYYQLLPKSLEDKNISLSFKEAIYVYPDFRHCIGCMDLIRPPEDCWETQRTLPPNTQVKALAQQVTSGGLPCTKIAMPDGSEGWITHYIRE